MTDDENATDGRASSRDARSKVWHSVSAGLTRVKPPSISDAKKILEACEVEATATRIDDIRGFVEVAARLLLNDAENAAKRGATTKEAERFWRALKKDPVAALDDIPESWIGLTFGWAADRAMIDLDTRDGCKWSREYAERALAMRNPRGPRQDLITLMISHYIEDAAEMCGVPMTLGHADRAGHKDNENSWRSIDADDSDPRDPPPVGLRFALHFQRAVEVAALAGAPAPACVHIRTFGSRPMSSFVEKLGEIKKSQVVG